MKQVHYQTILVILLVFIYQSQCFYTDDSQVINLTNDNFQQELLDSNDLWLVEFYAPWCGHCKKLTPEWEKAAKGLQGFVKLGAVDMTTNSEVGRPYDIQGYPTIKWFGYDKNQSPEEFDGGRTSSGIIAFATKKIKEIANTRIGNKRKQKPQTEQPKEDQQQKHEQDDGDVIVLTESNWQQTLEASNEPWFVEFYAPWCGHCKNLVPTWKKLASSQKGKVNIAMVDATQNNSLAQRFGVKGYPTLKFFPGGSKSDLSVETYSGGRDLEQLESFCAQYQPAKFIQLTNNDDYDKFCTQNPGICIVVFLPPIFDSSVEQRQQYLNQIENVANDYRGKPITFLWSEGGSQFDLENIFNVGGAGYPACIAITARKSMYSNFRGAFNESNFKDYVLQVSQGKGGFYSFNQKPVVKQIQKWENQQEINNNTRNDEL